MPEWLSKTSFISDISSTWISLAVRGREYISRFTQIGFLARMAQRESLYEGLEYHKI